MQLDKAVVRGCTNQLKSEDMAAVTELKLFAQKYGYSRGDLLRRSCIDVEFVILDRLSAFGISKTQNSRGIRLIYANPEALKGQV